MIKSMTAFARAEKHSDAIDVSLEIRTYNSRHLDVALRLPPGYQQMEDRVKKHVADKLARGRVELQMAFRDQREAAVLLEVNLPLARAYHHALSNLRSELGLQDPIRLDQLSGIHGIIKAVEVEKDLEASWLLLRSCLDDALAELERMRLKEGGHLAADLNGRIDIIEAHLARIKIESADLPNLYRQRLEERLGALTQGIVEIESERIIQEAAILADRSDISEEIVRAESHISQFRQIMAADEPAGRKLNFLLQEFNREFNTMGSKIGKAHVAHIIVEVKAEIEKLREQVQNVE
jgi:uncharacterized protein (TIGR00255 family)